MKLSAIVDVLNDLAPLRFAEGWDNVGLLVGDPEAAVARALVTVDYTAAVADEARREGATLVVAYHPPLFSAVKRVPHDALWADAIRRGVALFTMHTALDVAEGGTNDVLADACGISAASRRPIRPLPGAADETTGIGRIGETSAATRRGVLDGLRARFGLGPMLVAGPLDVPVRRVAVAAGAGGELIAPALAGGADLFVTGEIRHHDALAAVARGATVIATLHSNSERAGVRAFAARLAARLGEVNVTFSACDADPLTFA